MSDFILQSQIKALKDALVEKKRSVDQNVRTFVTNTALRVERAAKLSMKNTQTISAETRGALAESGRSVGRKVGKTGKFHLPAEPGMPPAIDTGRLVNSVTHNVESDGKTARVGTAVVYGKYLEYGHSHMLPRPWLRPALDSTREKTAASFRKIFGKDPMQEGEE